jgi:hypothetical protein
MSTLYRADKCSATDDAVPAPAVAGDINGASTYLTDGVFLFRVVGVFASRACEMVALEDCYWLDVVHVAVSDLRARRLRVVTPAPIED